MTSTTNEHLLQLIQAPRAEAGVSEVGRFLDSKESGPIIDVRSPSEYKDGHIPGSFNIPLFTDEERALVGTCYKTCGHDAAVSLGLSFVGPKVTSLAEKLCSAAGLDKRLRVLCFRGGMRSSSMIGLASLYGVQCSQLKGGYKAFRRYSQDIFEIQRNWKVLGGYTGSGKTQLLRKLRAEGQYILDLEELAVHRGSAFGSLPGCISPSTEQFENEIAYRLKDIPITSSIYVEDESRLVGNCVIPPALYRAFNSADLLLVNCSKEERIERIVQEYGALPRECLLDCLSKISKRLGREKERLIIESETLEIAVAHLLQYYDISYDHAQSKRLGTIRLYS